jgi:uncharacterized glyoxalase superfamily protein PhnB
VRHRVVDPARCTSSPPEDAVENRSAPPGPIVPNLVYADASVAARWLCERFGFEERLRWGPPDDPTVELEVGSGAVFVSGPGAGHGSATDLAFRPPRPSELSHTLMVAVDDVDAHHERSVRLGAELLVGIETYRFGERQYSARDLGGHVWTFTQSVADVAPEAWLAGT